MSVLHRVHVKCERCPTSDAFDRGYHAHGWLTIWMRRGVPLFDLENGPRAMREELDGIEREARHLCPACNLKLIGALTEICPSVISRDVTRDVRPDALDDDEDIPF